SSYDLSRNVGIRIDDADHLPNVPRFRSRKQMQTVVRTASGCHTGSGVDKRFRARQKLERQRRDRAPGIDNRLHECRSGDPFQYVDTHLHSSKAEWRPACAETESRVRDLIQVEGGNPLIADLE